MPEPGGFRRQDYLHVSSIIETLETIMRLRDPYTAGHQKRVAELAVTIGQGLGLSAESIETLEIAARLHDIGKIYVPTEILTKPGHISELEYALVQSHVTVGYTTLKQLKFALPVAEVVLQHHERNDGSGYPNGLTGEQILLEARILAVADVVEAILSHRPYRPALGLDLALHEIENTEGRYEKEIVYLCIELFRNNVFQFR